jgi:hypothetical protein
MSENHTFYNRKVASLKLRDMLGAVSPLMAAVVSAILSAQGHSRRTELVAAESLVELSLGALLQGSDFDRGFIRPGLMARWTAIASSR